MRTVLVVAFLISSVLMIGCEAPNLGGLNVQGSAINGGGQVTVAAILDNRPISDVPKDIAQIKEIVKEIRKFLETGKVSDLTMGEFKNAIDKLIPVQYRPYFNGILAAVSNITVPTDKIGPDNLYRIKEALDGIDYRVNRYNIDYHPPMTELQERGFGLTEVPELEVEYEIRPKRRILRGN